MYDSIQVTAGLLVLGQFGRSCRTDLEPKHSTDNRYPGERPEQMKVIDGIPVWGSPVDEGALKQIKNCARTADKVALMADHHKGYAVPIGGVVAYENSISPVRRRLRRRLRQQGRLHGCVGQRSTPQYRDPHG